MDAMSLLGQIRPIGQATTGGPVERMKRLALLWLCGCVTAGIVACSGPSTIASPPAPAAKVTATPTVTTNSGSPGISSPATAPSGKSAAAVVTNYYQAIAAQNYRLAFTYLAPNVTGPDGRRLTWPAFLQLARNMDGQGGPVTHFSVGVFPSVTVMTIDRKKYGPYHSHLQVARSGNGWTIISIDRV
jgi:hypothetical protein